MAARCLLYYITDRTAFAPDEPTRRRRLLEKIAEAARAGVDYIQLREKDLPTRDLESLAKEAVSTTRKAAAPNLQPLVPGLLINSRTDVALAAGADGVHLPSNDISPQDVKQIWAGCPILRDFRRVGGTPPSSQPPLIAVSCHSPAEVAQAAANGATLAVFAPVFEKRNASDVEPAGLPQLAQACRNNIPVLALGGVTLSNARSCLEAGAAGIAAIRLFQENDIATVIRTLRG
jgi:thiamine-phosphate pyrophosphorylase